MKFRQQTCVYFSTTEIDTTESPRNGGEEFFLAASRGLCGVYLCGKKNAFDFSDGSGKKFRAPVRCTRNFLGGGFYEIRFFNR